MVPAVFPRPLLLVYFTGVTGIHGRSRFASVKVSLAGWNRPDRVVDSHCFAANVHAALTGRDTGGKNRPRPCGCGTPMQRCLSGCCGGQAAPRGGQMFHLFREDHAMPGSEHAALPAFFWWYSPPVLYGGVSLLMFLINRNSVMENPLRQIFFSRRALACRSVAGAVANRPPLCGRARIGEGWNGLMCVLRSLPPPFPSGWLFSFLLLSPRATEPNGFI